MADLKDELIEYAKSIGADKIGVAEVENLKNPPQQQDFDPTNYVPDAQAVISVCLGYPNGVFGLDDKDMFTYGTSFGAVHSAMMKDLDSIAIKLIKFLEGKGYSSGYISPRKPYEEGGKLGGLFHSYIQKLIATLGGLGEEGTQGAFLTPEFGPKIVLGAIVTDAPLEPDGPNLVNKVCRKCFECVEVCPTSAISKENYPPYNFHRNRCLWATTGTLRATDVDEPDPEWVDARPNAMKLLPQYVDKHIKLRTILDWDGAVGEFPKCVRCITVCPAKGTVE
ncbi:MAG: hypothetical protein SVM80_06065 [Halobacteriota archaeon]|nr:hypothetical protein [Halobacteriota archaeon]